MNSSSSMIIPNKSYVIIQNDSWNSELYNTVPYSVYESWSNNDRNNMNFKWKFVLNVATGSTSSTNIVAVFYWISNTLVNTDKTDRI
jgi:hypothetical protein